MIPYVFYSCNTDSPIFKVLQLYIIVLVSPESAAVSILALFNALGRIAAGYISDKIGRIFWPADYAPRLCVDGRLSAYASLLKQKAPPGLAGLFAVTLLLRV